MCPVRSVTYVSGRSRSASENSTRLSRLRNCVHWTGCVVISRVFTVAYIDVCLSEQKYVSQVSIIH